MRAAICIALSLTALAAVAGPPLIAQRQAQLRNMLDQDCGSCHGLTRKGGLGPSLLPLSLAGKPKDLLVATVLYGRPGTAMPPWAPLLSPEEAGFLVDLMLTGDAQ